MAPRSRASLSDWYDRPVEDEATSEGSANEEQNDDFEGRHASASGTPSKQLLSPTKRSSPEFFIGDDSDAPSVECSPRKKLAMSPSQSTPGKGSTQETSSETLSILRGICSEYFENNVSPILRYVQSTQEQLMSQMKEVVAALDMKANFEDIPSVNEVASKVQAKTDDSKVQMQIRLEQLTTQLYKKANADSVPSRAELKAMTTGRDQGEMEARLKAAEEKVAALSSELTELKKLDSSMAPAKVSDITKVQAVFAAAGLRVDKQMKEMRHQMHQLREECLGKEVGERWPGRKLENRSVASLTSFSDNGSDKLSLGASACDSRAASHLNSDERAELAKIKTIVASAGQVYSRDLRDLKNQVRQLTKELVSVKTALGAQISGSKAMMMVG